jgi:hypothetical protein
MWFEIMRKNEVWKQACVGGCKAMFDNRLRAAKKAARKRC